MGGDLYYIYFTVNSGPIAHAIKPSVCIKIVFILVRRHIKTWALISSEQLTLGGGGGLLGQSLRYYFTVWCNIKGIYSHVKTTLSKTCKAAQAKHLY